MQRCWWSLLLAGVISLLSVCTTYAAYTTYYPAGGAAYIAPTITYDDNWSSGGNSGRYQGMSPKLGLGYGYLWESGVYFAGEIFGERSVLLSNHTNDGLNDLQTTWGFGASIIPGFQIDQVILAFVRLGTLTSFFSAANSYRTSYQAGVGGQVAVSPRWSVRGEYDFSRFGSMGAVGDVSPNVEQFSLGLIYCFC